MKNKRAIITLIVFISLVLFLVLFYIPYTNHKIKMKESFKGVVLKKYYKKGNTLDLKLLSGEYYTPHIGLKDNDFTKIELGDTVEMRNGEFVNLK